MKKNYSVNINALVFSFILAGTLIGILVAAQFQSSVVANSFLVDELNAQDELLKSYEKDQKELKGVINNLKEQIASNREQIAQFGNQAKLEQLERLKVKLGLSKLSGSGVRIVLTESSNKQLNSNANLIHAADLRDLINVLNTAQVDGISVNGHRVIFNSSINALGSEILLNKIKIASPFEINIIGDSTMIAGKLSERRLYPDLFDRISKKEINFNIEKLANINLEAYDGDYIVKYLKND